MGLEIFVSLSATSVLKCKKKIWVILSLGLESSISWYIRKTFLKKYKKNFHSGCFYFLLIKLGLKSGPGSPIYNYWLTKHHQIFILNLQIYFHGFINLEFGFLFRKWAAFKGFVGACFLKFSPLTNIFEAPKPIISVYSPIIKLCQ